MASKLRIPLYIMLIEVAQVVNRVKEDTLHTHLGEARRSLFSALLDLFLRLQAINLLSDRLNNIS